MASNIRARRFRAGAPERQRGAALAIGLILLLILTLLAVTGMNTASTELVMAGNEQYRQRAFHASDTGIEEAVAILPTVKQSCAPVEVLNKSVPGEAGDSYKVTAQYIGDGAPVSGASINEYAALSYELVSTGTSARNANAQHAQGAYVLQNKGDSFSAGC